VQYPAAYDSVIAVSSTDSNDDLSSFSSTGPEIDLAAPGESILSTVPGGTAYFSGTSMACPHVSGAGGLLMANGYTNSETRTRLQETAEDVGLSGSEQGNGLLDVETAVGDSSSSGIVEQNGHVEFEAEAFTGQMSGSGEASGSEWLSVSDSKASTGTALEAVPNEGVNVGDSTDGPRLDYEVEFNTTGMYYVWVRMKGVSGTDDSVHAGVDGTPATYGRYGLTDNSGDWAWVNDVGGNRVTVDVDSSGIHTVNVWMREDGTQIDQVLLTTDESFVPSGAL
jgi:hypothetical protein